MALNKALPVGLVEKFVYNITKNLDNPIKTVGRDSFLSPQTHKNTSFLEVTLPPGVAQPLYSKGHN